MKLSERMLWYRAKNDMSQEQLGEKCGLSKSTINQIETGYNSNPSQFTIMKIKLVVGGIDEDEIVNQQNKNIQSLPSVVQAEVCGKSDPDTEIGSIGDGQ